MTLCQMYIGAVFSTNLELLKHTLVSLNQTPLVLNSKKDSCKLNYKITQTKLQYNSHDPKAQVMRDGSNSFLHLGLFVVILMTSSFCGAFSFVEPLLNSESASGSKAQELSRSGPLSFI